MLGLLFVEGGREQKRGIEVGVVLAAKGEEMLWVARCGKKKGWVVDLQIDVGEEKE